MVAMFKIYKNCAIAMLIVCSLTLVYQFYGQIHLVTLECRFIPSNCMPYQDEKDLTGYITLSQRLYLKQQSYMSEGCKVEKLREPPVSSISNRNKFKPIVFLKPIKTASSCVAQVLERYGYYRNLTFALPPEFSRYFEPYRKKWHRDMPMKYNNLKKYDILVQHTRYDRLEMEITFPGAFYITIIRNPADHLESVFNYFYFPKIFGLLNSKNPMKEFLETPQFFLNMITDKHEWWSQLHNGQIYSLGLDHLYHSNGNLVKRKINDLNSEFDLVMIAEYFDESMVLLKKTLNLSNFEDVLYLPKGVRNAKLRTLLANDLVEKIETWEDVDWQLYRYFNQTFWKKIQDYGPTFSQDLEIFRKKQACLVNTCLDLNRMNNQSLENRKHNRVFLLEDSPKNCEMYIRGTPAFTTFLRRWQNNRKDLGGQSIYMRLGLS